MITEKDLDKLNSIEYYLVTELYGNYCKIYKYKYFPFKTKWIKHRITFLKGFVTSCLCTLLHQCHSVKYDKFIYNLSFFFKNYAKRMALNMRGKLSLKLDTHHKIVIFRKYNIPHFINLIEESHIVPEYVIHHVQNPLNDIRYKIDETRDKEILAGMSKKYFKYQELKNKEYHLRCRLEETKRKMNHINRNIGMNKKILGKIR